MSSLPQTPALESAATNGKSARFTLRKKLTWSLLSVGLSSLCLASLVYMSCDLLGVHHTIRQHCALLAERISWRWPAEGHDASWSSGLPLDENILWASLFDAQGEPIAAYQRDGHTDAAEWLNFLRPSLRHEVYRAGKRLGSVEVTASFEPFHSRLYLHAALLSVLAGVSTLITLALGRRIHHRFSDQLLDLAHAANAISRRKDYSIRAVRRSDDEIGILVDTFNHMITQIELRERQLKAEVKRAEAARIAKSQFLATMSHEIRTPINGVVGMTQLLLDTELTEDQAEFATTIHSSADSLMSIINDILDFSKGEAGRHEIEAIEFDPAKVVHECLDTVSIVAAEKKLELCLDLDERLSKKLIGDPSRLRQVLLNLLSNALKFTPQGEIVLRVHVEEAQDRSARIRFEVQDTGIGIPQDRIDRLFQSFSQIDASRTRKYGGTGLGLAISKQIVEAMGGSMFVKTREGEGSTFGFKLQLEAKPSVTEPNLLAAPSSLRILIADPSPTSSGALTKLLQEGNLLTLASDTGSARMHLMEATRENRFFDLILVDLRLAEAFESLEVIASEQLATAPMLILAPVNQLVAATKIPWRGRKAALAKPVKRNDLYWCIAETLRGPIPSKKASERTPEPEPALFEDLCVLVAEDHPVNLRITTRFLDKLGIAWEVVANGEEAVQAVKERDFDLILMDVQMPVMDGLEATLAIRKLESLSGAHVPIVALTANVLEEHRREAHQAGFDDYLPKPVKLEELRAKIHKWIVRSLASS